MEKKHAAGKTGQKPARKRIRRKRMTTDELRKKHLGDKNNVITDDDIRNIKIDTSVHEKERLDLPKGDERPHDSDKDHRITTPWDVIDEP